MRLQRQRVRAQVAGVALEGLFPVLGGTITLIYGMLFYFDAHSRPNGPSILRLPAAAAISFLVGFGPGAFLGGLIPKKDTVTEPVGEGEICPEG